MQAEEEMLHYQRSKPDRIVLYFLPFGLCIAVYVEFKYLIYTLASMGMAIAFAATGAAAYFLARVCFCSILEVRCTSAGIGLKPVIGKWDTVAWHEVMEFSHYAQTTHPGMVGNGRLRSEGHPTYQLNTVPLWVLDKLEKLIQEQSCSLQQ